MSERKNLNSETTRTLKKTLGIPVKLCAAINRYKRRKGKFNHIDELWRIPGMTRKFYDQIKQKYAVNGQKAPLIGEDAPFESSSAPQTTDTGSKSSDSRSFPSLRPGWRKSIKPTPVVRPSREVGRSCAIDDGRMGPSGSRNTGKGNSSGSKSPGSVNNVSFSREKSKETNTLGANRNLSSGQMSPIRLPEGFSDEQRILLPINVQQSPSGERLFIVYSCSPQRSIRKPVGSPEKGKANMTKTSSPERSGSRSPSILKQSDAGKAVKSKSHLEESRQKSPERDKRVDFKTKDQKEGPSSSGSYRSARRELMSKNVGQSTDDCDEVVVESILEETYQAIQGPLVTGPMDIAVASGAKVSEWIESNRDFMRSPEKSGSLWGSMDRSFRPRTTGETTRLTRHGDPKSKVSQRRGSPARPSTSRQKDGYLRQRGARPAIKSSEIKRNPSPRRKRSSTSSLPKSQTVEESTGATPRTQTRKSDETEGDSRLPLEYPAGYTIHRKRYRRERSREKSPRLAKRKTVNVPPESSMDPSQSCTVI